MSQLLAFARPLSLGWVVLARRLARAPQRRSRPFAPTESMVWRSECFAEDLPEPAVKPLKHGRAALKRR